VRVVAAVDVTLTDGVGGHGTIRHGAGRLYSGRIDGDDADSLQYDTSTTHLTIGRRRGDEEGWVVVWLVNTAVSLQETCFRGPSATDHGTGAVGCLTEVESAKLRLMCDATFSPPFSTSTYTTAPSAYIAVCDI